MVHSAWKFETPKPYSPPVHVGGVVLGYPNTLQGALRPWVKMLCKCSPLFVITHSCSKCISPSHAVPLCQVNNYTFYTFCQFLSLTPPPPPPFFLMQLLVFQGCPLSEWCFQQCDAKLFFVATLTGRMKQPIGLMLHIQQRPLALPLLSLSYPDLQSSPLSLCFTHSHLSFSLSRILSYSGFTVLIYFSVPSALVLALYKDSCTSLSMCLSVHYNGTSEQFKLLW